MGKTEDTWEELPHTVNVAASVGDVVGVQGQRFRVIFHFTNLYGNHRWAPSSEGSIGIFRVST